MEKNIKKVVIIEDDPDCSEIIKEMIEEKYYCEAIMIDDAADAMAYIKENISDIDLLILDIMMPRSDIQIENAKYETGMQLFVNTRGLSLELPIVIISVVRNTEIKSLITIDSRTGSINKPFSNRDLYSKISELF